MKNIVLDIMMGIICILLTCSIFGAVFLDDVFDAWERMRQ